MKRILQSLVVLIVFFAGCKKSYEDDPFFINLRSPEARIHGTWDLESLIIGGNDSTAAVKDQICYVELTFLDAVDGAYNNGNNLIGRHIQADTCNLIGHFGFPDHHNNLSLWGGFDMRQVGPFPCGEIYPGIFWKINKLTGSQLWIETTYNGLFCSAHLKKTS